MTSGSATFTGSTLVLRGDVDRVAVRALGAAHLDDVTTVDATGATHLGTDAVHLVVRCLRHAAQRRPPDRLRVAGADHRLRASLDMLGVTAMLDLRP